MIPIWSPPINGYFHNTPVTNLVLQAAPQYTTYSIITTIYKNKEISHHVNKLRQEQNTELLTNANRKITTIAMFTQHNLVNLPLKWSFLSEKNWSYICTFDESLQLIVVMKITHTNLLS